jgi:radical SAM superfamily enzyme YgiQ (UPF0313 family)
MRLLFLYPQHVGKEDVPPIELMQASAVVSPDVQKRLIDLNINGRSIEDLLEEIRDFSPNLILCLGRSIKTYSQVKNLSDIIKRAFDVPLICCGDIRVAYRTLLNKGEIDGIVNGDVEAVLPKVLRSIKEHGLVNDTPGLITLRNGMIVGERSRLNLVNLDTAPFPDYDLIDSKHYFGDLDKDEKCNVYRDDERSKESYFKGRRSIEIVSSRGCNHSCSFCINRCTKNRRHSIEYVINHLKLLTKDYNVGMVDFGDSCFTEDKKWVEEFVNGLMEEDIKILFRIYGARTDQVDKSLLKKLKAAGCTSIYFGIESFSQDHLDYMRKGTTVQQNIDALVWAREIGLHSPVQLILGLPGENEKILERTLSTLREKGIELSREKVRYVLPIPGTPIYDLFTSFGIIKDEEDYLLTVSDINTTNNWNMGANRKVELFVPNQEF